MKINWTKELLEEIVLKSNSQKEILSNLGIRAAGGNFTTLRKYLKLYEISTEHFIRNYDNMVYLNLKNKKDIEDYLVENSTCSRSNLKRRLLEEKLLHNKCSICGQDENWKGIKISLILDHINGIHNDNRLENLRIVCPNCNAGLDTFAGKNNIKKINLEKICKCGNSKDKKSDLCNKCNGLRTRKVERPPYKELRIDVKLNGYSAVGRKYGVSDNAIKKWLLNYNLEEIIKNKII